MIQGLNDCAAFSGRMIRIDGTEVHFGSFKMLPVVGRTRAPSRDFP
jgi:hypothetical protein